MLSHELFEALDGEREVRAAFVADDGVNLIDDQRARGFEHPAAAFAGQKDGSHDILNDARFFQSRDDDDRQFWMQRSEFQKPFEASDSR